MVQSFPEILWSCFDIFEIGFKIMLVLKYLVSEGMNQSK